MNLLVDQNLTNFLRDKVTGFSDMTVKQQQSFVVLLVINTSTNQYKHREYPDCFYIPAKIIDDMFGRGRFGNLMENLYPILLYREGSYSADFGNTYAYKITDKAYLLLDDFLSSRSGSNSVLYDAKSGKVFRKAPKNAILSKDKDDRTKKANFQICSAQEVNMEALKQLQSDLIIEKEKLRKKRFCLLNSSSVDEEELDLVNSSLVKNLRLLFQVNHVLNYANNNIQPDSMIMQYMEAPSGRLYGTGVHLQNMMKDVRNAALEGLYDYDIENCHFALLSQMARVEGYECSVITHYLKHKSKIRERIAQDIGISVKDAKKCLLAMVYGAGNSKWFKAAIPQAIGQEKADDLYIHSVYAALKHDVEKARTLIIKGAKKQRGHYINAMGKGIPTSESENKVLAHLVQGMEAKILNVVGEMHTDNIALLQHDGWVTKTAIDKESTIDRIYSETGIRVELSEEIITNSYMQDRLKEAS